MKLYWFHFSKRLLPVVVHFDKGKTETFGWSRIHGVQIGPWFIGVIRGERQWE